MKNFIKKLSGISLSLLLLFSTTTAVYAKGVEVRNVRSDQYLPSAEIMDEFSDLDELESIILSNNLTDVNSVKSFDEKAINNFSSLEVQAASASINKFDFDTDFDLVSGLWGFICCPIGFFVVAISKDKTHEEKVSYWIGVAVSTALSIVYNIATLAVR